MFMVGRVLPPMTYESPTLETYGSVEALTEDEKDYYDE